LPDYFLKLQKPPGGSSATAAMFYP
jgi:hypothetical protein